MESCSDKAAETKNDQGGLTLQTKKKKVLAVLLGWVFVALGVIGIILPILPGIPLLLVGLFILSSEYVGAHQLLGKIRKRFPETSRKAREWVGVSPQRGDGP
jgi:uncharacterized membrane protein YbaN (DUF454 family)